MAVIRIDIYRLHFTVQSSDHKVIETLNFMGSNLKTFRFEYDRWTRRVMKKPDKEYYIFDKKERKYRYCINILRNVMATLGSAGFTRNDIEVVSHNDEYKIEPIDLKFDNRFELRDYQQKYSDILTNPDGESILLVDLLMGMGKTLIAMHSVVRLNMRTAIFILPKYIDKWIEDVTKYTDITDDQVCVVRGSESLISLMEEENPQYAIIIFSMKTMQNYISDYENTEIEFMYPVRPQDLMQKLKIGLIVNDEAHQHFHAMNKNISYFNAYKLIGLSATLDSNNPQLRKIYNTVYPVKNRISNIAEYENYIQVKAIGYNFQSLKSIRYSRKQGYNHVLFEQSILRNSVARNDYFEMILYYLDECYIKKRTKGDKCIIFCATVDMCSYLTKYLNKELKSHKLEINRYVQEDPYESLMNSDISVTTLNSAGTAVDIPNLISVLQTVSVASLQSNKQSLGRLRKLEGKETWYYYVYCKDIPNQYRMHCERRDTIIDTVKEFQYGQYYKKLRIH